ncbi:hypothetical protein CR513_04827, partial [Mucuna pruriens]
METDNLLVKLISMNYKGRGNIREYIMQMSAKLKSLKLELDEDLIEHLALISLPTHFGQFKYGYLYLIHEKSQSLDVFKYFEAEVELQLGKKIKAIKSDRGGEYYDRYDESREQRPGPFALFLKECGIVPQYTMLAKPSMNSVAERRKRTDMTLIIHSTMAAEFVAYFEASNHGIWL